MKKFLSILLVSVMTISLTLNVSANSIEAECAVLSGIEMSIDEFNDTYVESQKVSIDRKDYNICSLKITEVEFSNELLKANVNLHGTDNFSISFEICGTLYSGYKNQLSELNSVIVDANSDVSGVSVLLFEMLFSDEDVATNLNVVKEKEVLDTCFMVSEPDTFTSSLRLYILIEDTIYMFENDLPAILEQCNNNYMQITNPAKDLLWFSSIVIPDVELVDASEMISIPLEAYSTNAGPISWTADNIYQISFDVGGITYVQRSLPFGYYRICDVTTSNSTWKGEFYISESTTVDGQLISGVENLIRYKNIQVSMVVGESTDFSSAALAGQVKKANFLTGNDIADVLSACIEWWDIGVSIVNVLSALIDTGENIKLGDSFEELFPSGTTAISVSIPYTKCELFNSSYSSENSNNINTEDPAHYLIIQADVHSTLNSSTTEITTTGCIEFSWDVFLNSTLENVATDVTKTFTKLYSNSH